MVVHPTVKYQHLAFEIGKLPKICGMRFEHLELTEKYATLKALITAVQASSLQCGVSL